jgi:hypothetical protein
MNFHEIHFYFYCNSLNRARQPVSAPFVLYCIGGQTVCRGQLFGRSRPLFDLYQNLFAASVRSTALRLTAVSGSTYLCEGTFCRMKIIKSRYGSHLTYEHSKCYLDLYLSNYEPSFSKLSENMQHHASPSQ